MAQVGSSDNSEKQLLCYLYEMACSRTSLHDHAKIRPSHPGSPSKHTDEDILMFFNILDKKSRKRSLQYTSETKN
jgi:hypothetical protein